MAQQILDRQFYNRDPVIVAQQILGMQLVSTLQGKRTSGIVVETEAYLATGDPASHSFSGPSRKNLTMFGPAGFAYVYSIHAKFCFNVVTENSMVASAVLIRAIEPVEGVPTMQVRRKQTNRPNLCSGPAKICQSFGIDKTIDGVDLTRRRKIWLQVPNTPQPTIEFRSTKRIGVTSAKSRKFRFVIGNHAYASGPNYLR